MVLWKKYIFVIFCSVLILSRCGDVSISPILSTNSTFKIIIKLTVDSSAFSLPTFTSKDEIEIDLNVNKMTGASSLIFSTNDMCLGEIIAIEKKIKMAVSKELLNTTFDVYVQLKNEGSKSACVKLKTVTHDSLAPANSSIAINSGAAVTSSSSVTLTLVSTGASEVYVTNTPGCSEGGSWAPFSTPATQSWTLGQTNDTATVYAKFKDEAENESACTSAQILHDGVVPSNSSITINSGASVTTSTSVTLTLVSTGASEVYITNTPGCSEGGSWTAFSTPATQNWTLGQTNDTATVYAKFKDEADNESACTSARILHDGIVPTNSSIVINNGASTTVRTSVTLTLVSTGASEVYVTNTPGCSTGGSWAPFSTPATQNWILGQTNGTATVYAKFRDEATNESSCISSSINHYYWFNVSSTVQLSDNNLAVEGVEKPQVAFDSSGKSLAVWQQYDGTRYNIWADRFDGAAWGSAQLIETNNAGDAKNSQIAVDPSGKALAVWEQHDGARYNIWSNRFDGTAWGTAQLIETDNVGNANNPQIAVDSSGKALAVWEQYDGARYNIWSNRFDGASWGTAQLIETDDTGYAVNPQIAVDLTGKALAIWQQFDGSQYNILSKSFEDNAWTFVQRISNNSDDAYDPQIAFDRSGKAVAIWAQIDGSKQNIWVNRFHGSTWGIAKQIEDNAGNAFGPQIAVSASGKAIAVWTQRGGDLTDSVWSSRFDGTTWETAQLLENSAEDATNPQIAFDLSENAIVVWVQSDGIQNNVYANRFDGAAWGTAQFVEDDDGQAYAPQIAIDPSGKALVVWHKSGIVLDNIWSNFAGGL